MDRVEEPNHKIALILGGARSGKSAFAERLAERWGEPVLFVATASAIDAEMMQRIAAHRSARPDSWRSVEAPLNVGSAIREQGAGSRAAIVDCLTLLVANCLVGPEHDHLDDIDADVAAQRVQEEIEDLLEAARRMALHLVVVSNEVGMGVVPPYETGRVFRDLLGRANQRIAEVAEAVYLMVAGIPIDVKRLAGS